MTVADQADDDLLDLSPNVRDRFVGHEVPCKPELDLYAVFGQFPLTRRGPYAKKQKFCRSTAPKCYLRSSSLIRFHAFTVLEVSHALSGRV